MAVLAAVDLKRDGYAVKSMYGFGTPRVGDTGFEDAFHQELGLVDTQRIFSTDNHGVRDAVTLIPRVDFALPVVPELAIANDYSCSSWNPKTVALCIKGLHTSYKFLIPTLSGVAIAASGIPVASVVQTAAVKAKSVFSSLFA
jgi:hypothetical protein